VSSDVRRVRVTIAIVAALVILGLFVLKRIGVDEMLFRILAIAGGLLVTMLFVTYRALLKMVEAARTNPHPPPPDDDEDDR
jgi:hypothetical protein